MRTCTLLLGVLAACAVSYALEQGPLLAALQPAPEALQSEESQQLEVVESQPRQKRHLLLAGAALGGAALLGAGALGAGALGAGALVGAKAGLVGGVLASKAFHGHGRGYGGYGGYGYGGGYGHGYGGGYGHGYGGGYGGGYHSYSPSYYTRSYPSYVVEESWY